MRYGFGLALSAARPLAQPPVAPPVDPTDPTDPTEPTDPGNPSIYATVPTRLSFRPEGVGNFIVAEGMAMEVPGTTRVMHTVYLTGLAPGTTYEFRLPSGITIRTNYVTYAGNPTTSLVIHWQTDAPKLQDYRALSLSTTARKTFTAPATISEAAPYRIAAISDSHGRGNVTTLMASIAARNPHLIVHSGDMANGNGGSNGPDTWYIHGATLNAAVDTHGRRIPFIPNIGNHECLDGSAGVEWGAGAAGRKPDFDAGIRGDTEWYYCFFPAFPGLRGFGLLDFGNYLSLWSLDPGISTRIDDPADSQKAWLQATLAARQAVPHKIASMHYSPYPNGRRVMLNYTLGVREHFAPIMHAGGMRTVLVGHDHVMGYTVPISDWSLDGHQRDIAPAAIGEGIEFLGNGTPASGDNVRDGRNPATKWWIADSRAAVFTHYDFEKPGWNGDPLHAEPRAPHAGDGATFPDTGVAHYWFMTLTPAGRTLEATTIGGEKWVTLERGIDAS